MASFGQLWPAGQGEQTADPAITEKDPGGQGLGLTAPSRFEKYPASTILGAL